MRNKHQNQNELKKRMVSTMQRKLTLQEKSKQGMAKMQSLFKIQDSLVH